MNNDLEERVARLEKLVEKMVQLAQNHPMGRMFLKMLGE